jgi:hypothetical protein
MVFTTESKQVPQSTIKLLNHQIGLSLHDIESIETYIAKQDEASISIEQVRLLRGLQDMYRQRIVSHLAEISECKWKLEVCSERSLAL